ncbi:MAG: galactokinase [Acidobacteriota bacterium]|nr:galactokinase [Acidobacteriota bacterium]
MARGQQVISRFRARFRGAAALYRAPGRVNLIGEHTDYNDGFVLPAAIGFSCWAAVAPRDDRKLVIHSENFSATIEADLDDLKPFPESTWANYPLAVAWALEQAGHRLSGANMYIAGDVPLGAGLSSSAAIEVSAGFALLDISCLPIDRTDLALRCQRAENDFVGARCGIMDQFVSCHGQADHALLLDCRSLEMRMLPIPPGVSLIICNTMVKHELGASEYNTRREECEEAVRALSKVLPGLRALRDVTATQLQEHRNLLSSVIYKRAHHVVTENDRVLRAAEAFQSAAIEKLGQLMADSHRSLRQDYEVSCPELDILVEIAARQRGVFGARMTGGGFGGCTINLVDVRHAREFQQKVSAAYKSATGLQPDIYVCKASQGAEAVQGGSAMAANPSAAGPVRENP